MKKTIRSWFWKTLLFWIAAIGLCVWANSSAKMASGVALLCALIFFILFLKNNTKNANLLSTISEYGDVLKVPALAATYKNLRFMARFIWVLDLLLITSVITFPFKIYFWISYRVFRSAVKKLRKLVLKGEKLPTSGDIEDDPFYSFLIREGLFEKAKITTKSSLEIFMEEKNADVEPEEEVEFQTLEEAKQEKEAKDKAEQEEKENKDKESQKPQEENLEKTSDSN